MVSRRIRRDWVVALSAGLFSSLAPGCVTPRSTGTPLQQAPLAQASKEADSDTMSGKPPYPMVPGPPVPVITPTTKPASAASPSVQRAEVVSIRATTKPVGADVPDVEPREGKVTGRLAIAPFRVEPAGREESSEDVAHKMPEPPLLAALRCYLEKRPREALHYLDKFDPLNQELLICLLPLAVQLAEAAKPSDRESAVAVEQLESVMYGLRTRAPLMVEKMCLCKSISAFGLYEAMPEEHVFQPGEQLRVYAELRNFSSERRDGSGGPAVFVTRLSSTAEIRDQKDKTVWKQPLQRGEPDRSQTPRHDYFDHYCFFLPELRPGWYTLEVTVEDLATHRRARHTVELKVGLVPQGS